jgi:hypothetical protein
MKTLKTKIPVNKAGGGSFIKKGGLFILEWKMGFKVEPRKEDIESTNA